MSVEVKQCGSCGEPIYWLKHERTGRPAPIEVRTSAGGNIVVNLTAGTYTIERPDPSDTFRHLNHFSTCPQAKVWTKPIPRWRPSTNRRAPG